MNRLPHPRIASYTLRPNDTLAAAARKIIARQAARVRAHAPGTREGRDPEALHDMRVATRRLRFALRLFAPWMPPGRADRLRADLRRVALVLGRVRDLDVLMERLPSWMDQAELTPEERGAVTATLRRKRAQGRAGLVRMLAGNWFAGRVLILERVPLTGDAEGPAREEADRMVRLAARALRRWSRRADLTRPRDLHRLRILFKRLRYTCEYFNDLYGGALEGAIARFIRFQDCLGGYQDAVVAASILDGLKVGGGLLKAGDCSHFSEANNKLQATLREQRGLQREAFSELWTEFPLILRAFLNLIELEPFPPPLQRPATASSRQGR